MLKLRLQRSGPETGLGLAVRRQPEEAGLWQLRVYSEEARACQRGKVPLLGGTREEGWDHYKSFFPCEHSQATRHQLQELPGQVRVTNATVGSRSGHRIPLQDPQAGAKRCSCCPGTAQRAAAPRRATGRRQALRLMSRERMDCSRP